MAQGFWGGERTAEGACPLLQVAQSAWSVAQLFLAARTRLGGGISVSHSGSVPAAGTVRW